MHTHAYAAGMTTPIPAAKIEIFLGSDLDPPPTPYPLGNSKICQEGPEASVDGICHRNLPQDFIRWALDISLWSTIRWLQHHEQGQGERSKEEWGPMVRSREPGQPLGMLPFCA